ncbi:MAG: DUF262 domain-containing protein [Aggregatibacter segnis]|uniref:DUF262 domain-containing protein n=1 Tax=Aggregatibacter segnis TaxID=739 RepID=UPI003F9F5533
MTNISQIIEDVEKQVTQTHTRQLDLSFNEIADMYKSGELNISPSFQRLFRWSEDKQSRFIESLILEMPVPPIFVIEIENGNYELIDGLQRISSYLNFRGLLKKICRDEDDSESDNDSELDSNSEIDSDSGIDNQYYPALVLTGCDIAPSLNSLTYNELPAAFQIRLKRSFVRVQVIRKESNKVLRYHMFKRLNTGGEKLEPQEIRNCNIRLLDNKFADFLKNIAKDDNFTSTVKTTEEKLKSAYLEELALRYFAYKNYRYKYKKDIEPFLDEYMESVSLPQDHVNYQHFRYDDEERIFKKLFSILNKSLGPTSFGAITNSGNRISESFRIYHFEAITQGMLPVLEYIDENSDDSINMLKIQLETIKKNNDFIDMTTGGGKNTHNRLSERISFVENHLKEVFTNNGR